MLTENSFSREYPKNSGDAGSYCTPNTFTNVASTIVNASKSEYPFRTSMMLDALRSSIDVVFMSWQQEINYDGNLIIRLADNTEYKATHKYLPDAILEILRDVVK